MFEKLRLLRLLVALGSAVLLSASFFFALEIAQAQGPTSLTLVNETDSDAVVRELPSGEGTLGFWVSASITDAQSVQLCVQKVPEIHNVACSEPTRIALNNKKELTVTLSGLAVAQTTSYTGTVSVQAANATDPISRELELTVEIEAAIATAVETSTLALAGVPTAGEPLVRTLPPGDTGLTMWVSAAGANAKHAQMCVTVEAPESETVECSTVVTITANTQANLSVTLPSMLAEQAATYSGTMQITADNADPYTSALKLTLTPSDIQLRVSHDQVTIQGTRSWPWSSTKFPTSFLSVSEIQGREVEDVVVLGQTLITSDTGRSALLFASPLWLEPTTGSPDDTETAFTIPLQSEVRLGVAPTGAYKVGSYEGNLRIQSSLPSTVTTATTAVTVNVKHQPFAGFVVIFLGVLVSSVVAYWSTSGRERSRKGIEIAAHKLSLEELEKTYRPNGGDLWSLPAYSRVNDLLHKAELMLRSLLSKEATEEIEKADSELDAWKQAATAVSQVRDQLKRGETRQKQQFGDKLPSVGIAGEQSYGSAKAALQIGNMTAAVTQANKAIEDYHQASPYYLQIKYWLDRCEDLPSSFKDNEYGYQDVAREIHSRWIQGIVLDSYKQLADNGDETSLAALATRLAADNGEIKEWHFALTLMAGVSHLLMKKKAKAKLRKAMEDLLKKGAEGLKDAVSEARKAHTLDQQLLNQIPVLREKIEKLRKQIKFKQDPALGKLQEAEKAVDEVDVPTAQARLKEARRLHQGFASAKGSVHKAIKYRKGFRGLDTSLSGAALQGVIKADKALAVALADLAQGEAAATEKALNAYRQYNTAFQMLEEDQKKTVKSASALDVYQLPQAPDTSPTQAPVSPPPLAQTSSIIARMGEEGLPNSMNALYENLVTASTESLAEFERLKALYDDLVKTGAKQSKDLQIIATKLVAKWSNIYNLANDIYQLNETPVKENKGPLPTVIRLSNYRRLVRALNFVTESSDNSITEKTIEVQLDFLEKNLGTITNELNKVKREVENLRSAFANECQWRGNLQKSASPPEKDEKLPHFPWHQLCILDWSDDLCNDGPPDGAPLWFLTLWEAISELRVCVGPCASALKKLDKAYEECTGARQKPTIWLNDKVITNGSCQSKISLQEKVKRFWKDLWGNPLQPVAKENTLDDNFIFEIKKLEVNKTTIFLDKSAGDWRFQWEFYPCVNNASVTSPVIPPTDSNRLIHRFEVAGCKTLRLTVIGAGGFLGVSKQFDYTCAIEVLPSRLEVRVGTFLRSRAAAMLVAFILASLSGLYIHASQPTFGLWPHYLLAFLWGSGFDQVTSGFAKLPEYLRGLLNRDTKG